MCLNLSKVQGERGHEVERERQDEESQHTSTLAITHDWRIRIFVDRSAISRL
jgi:hypothetical protein